MSDAPADPGRVPDGPVARFLTTLEREDHVLLVLRDELYEGSWQEMRRDLIDRREGRPCVFKLAQRIAQDIERIDRLAEFECSHKVNLADYLDVKGTPGVPPPEDGSR